jgi:hypothetical protein
LIQQQSNPLANLLPWAILGGLFLYLDSKRKPVRRNLDAYTDASGKVHPIRGTEGYNSSKAGESSGHALPTLTGSPKQIAWAEDIRRGLLAEAHELPVGKKQLPVYEKRAQQLVMSQSSAKWWIENRGRDTRETLRTLKERLGDLKFGEDKWTPASAIRR